MSKPPSQTNVREKRKIRTGMVVSDRMRKTIIVRIDRLVDHPFYPRVIRRSSSVKVHDERNDAKIGDWVKIMETRPISKDKRWRLVEIIRRGSTAPAIPEDEFTAEARPSRPPEAATTPEAPRAAQSQGESA